MIGIFGWFFRAGAVISGIFGVVAFAGAAMQAPAAAGALHQALHAGIFIAVGSGMLIGSRILWLATVPHSERHMRRWRRAWWSLWLFTMLIAAAIYWIAG